MRSVHFTYVCFRLQVEKVKIYPDIPYVLPKSYSKLAANRPTVSENVKTVECQVTEEPASTMVFFRKDVNSIPGYRRNFNQNFPPLETCIWGL